MLIFHSSIVICKLHNVIIYTQFTLLISIFINQNTKKTNQDQTTIRIEQLYLDI